MANNVKDYLGRVYRANEFINTKEDQLNYLRDMSVKTTSIINASGVRNSSNENKKEIILCKIVDLEQDLLTEINTVIDLNKEVSGAIKRVEDPDYRLILECRYLNHLTWSNIAEQLGFTPQWVNVLHNRALKELEEKQII